MKELYQTSCNKFLMADGTKLTEVILTTAEADYALDKKGALQKIKTCETFRFIVTEPALMALIANLAEMAGIKEGED